MGYDADLDNKIIALFKNNDEFDKLFEVIGTYLDAVILLLIEKKIITNEELQDVLSRISEQNAIEKQSNPTIETFDVIGFMNPVIGEA